VQDADWHWRYAQQARWVAEDGLRRMRRGLGDGFSSAPLAAQALLYAGYANRLLGENMCVGVIDGGPAEPREVYFRRAEAAFTEAAEIAGRGGDAAAVSAARAGRAAARVWLGDWDGAAADARAVPAGFVFQARYSAIELDQYNRIHWSNANQPYRNLTAWGTFYESYYAQTRDPRVAWVRDPKVPTTATGDPWYAPAKYPKRESPITLSSGREMRLILAEAALRGGDWRGALALLNERRTELGLAPLGADGAEAAWGALKRERGIELWLEGRRLGDLHRWLAERTPGGAEDMEGRSTCFPIGQSELDSNPNLTSPSP